MKIKMKNNKTFASLLFVFCFALMAGQNTYAQCQLVITDASGAVINTTSVPCDFFVYMDTGSPETDAANYTAAKDAWANTHQSDYVMYISENHRYFEIPQAEFDAMTPERQSGIQQRPELYHIVQ
jgi:hypothetical protein